MSVSGFYQAVVQRHGNIADAARALGVARTTLRDRIDRERRLHGVVDVASETHQLSLPVLPESRPSIDEILERMTGDFETKRAATDAAEWFPVAVRDNKPFGLWVWGDPHLDNPGCDISLLRHHIELARHPAVFSLNIGDTLDGWVGRLVRLYGESSIDVHNARELALWFMREVRWLLWLAGNHDCVTPDHEVLTRRGWVKFPNVLPEDEVYGRTPDGSGVWQSINEIVSFPFNGRLNSIRSRGVSINCTDNHRVLLVNRGGGKARYFPAGRLQKYAIVPVSAVSGQGVDFTDDEIRLMAWLSTDCCIQPKKLTISQSKPERVAEIKALLCRLGLGYSISVRDRGITEVCGRRLVKPALPEQAIYLNAETSKALINKFGLRRDAHPDCVGEMTEAQFDVYMNTVIAADGSWISNTATVYGSPGSLNDLQRFAVTKGWTATFSVDNRGDDRLYVRKKTEQIVVGPHEKMDYAGDVWCLRVPAGNFMVRHNGKAHFTGNSWADNEAILRLMSKQPGVKLLPWQAKFTLDFPSGASFKVHAAHDFPGRSMANIVHGHMRAARFTSPADLFLAGHLHDWGSSQFEMAGFNRTPVSLRVRGYKTIDSYAVVNGYQSSRFGGSCLVIIDPNIEGPGSIQPYWNVEQGIDVLDILAKRYQGEPRGKDGPRSEVLRVRAPAAKPAGGEPPVRRARKAAGRKAAAKRSDAPRATAPAAGKGRRRQG